VQILLKIWVKVMGALKQQYSDDIDFAKAGAILKQLLN
jgi:uncharacterized protein YqeY